MDHKIERVDGFRTPDGRVYPSEQQAKEEWRKTSTDNVLAELMDVGPDAISVVLARSRLEQRPQLADRLFGVLVQYRSSPQHRGEAPEDRPAAALPPEGEGLVRCPNTSPDCVGCRHREPHVSRGEACEPIGPCGCVPIAIAVKHSCAKPDQTGLMVCPHTHECAHEGCGHDQPHPRNQDCEITFCQHSMKPGWRCGCVAHIPLRDKEKQ